MSSGRRFPNPDPETCSLGVYPFIDYNRVHSFSVLAVAAGPVTFRTFITSSAIHLAIFSAALKPFTLLRSMCKKGRTCFAVIFSLKDDPQVSFPCERITIPSESQTFVHSLRVRVSWHFLELTSARNGRGLGFPPFRDPLPGWGIAP
jgi:hypothetical protein